MYKTGYKKFNQLLFKAYVCDFIYIYCILTGFGGLGVSMLAFGTQVRRCKPGRGCRIFKGKKILSTPSFRREVKPLVPCRRFVACKRSLNGVEVIISAKLPDKISRPQFRLSLLGISHVVVGVEAPGDKNGNV
jgi:hypothetical protein